MNLWANRASTAAVSFACVMSANAQGGQMGSGGHNRKPKKTKIICGTFRSDRNPKNEPKPEPIKMIPKPPPHLNRYSKRLWKSLSTELVEKGIFTVVDQAALEVCCVAFGE